MSHLPKGSDFITPGTPEYYKPAREILLRPTPFDALLRKATERAVADPNDEMLDADENDVNRREFEQVKRKKTIDKLFDTMSPPTPMGDGQDDGETLTHAIEKTLGGALHPQAMWRTEQ